MTSSQVDRLQRRLYSRMPLIGGWVRRRAADALTRDGSPDAIRTLAEATTRIDDRQLVQHIVLRALWPITEQSSIDAVCEAWTTTRHHGLARLLSEKGWVASAPAGVRVLSALKQGQIEVVAVGGRDAIASLVAACEDVDQEISLRAREAIAGLKNPDGIDALCAQWVERRGELLTQAVVAAGYVARQPPPARVLSALKTAQRSLITGSGEEVVAPLIRACEDADLDIARRARLALAELEHEDAVETLCHHLIDSESPCARESAVAARYAPKDLQKRALFFFLTEQWNRYDGLDFDCRVLRMAYEDSASALQKRVREKLRATGRADYLTVVTGGDYHSRAEVLTSDESQLLVQMLATEKAWAKLWVLVFELSFAWSARIVRILVNGKWRPEREEERETFERLVAHAFAGLAESAEEISRHLPPAVRRAHARVPGRVNDVAFSPRRPVVAVGTGQRKVALWNFQRAERELVLDGFAHSVGRVAFTRDGTLLCAERTNSTSEPCAVYTWKDGQRVRLGKHAGSVTAIEPVGKMQALATGRDHRTVVWDIGARRRVAEQRYRFWARSLRVSSDGQYAALLHRGLTLVDLPGLSKVAYTGGGKSVLRCAAFSPDGKTLIVGKNNGEIILVDHIKGRLQVRRQQLRPHLGRVEGIEMLADRSVMVTAGSEGVVRFVAWPGQELVGTLQVPGERLTSIHVSPDGAFLAIGDSNAALSLWDLRVLDVPGLFAQPFARAEPVHLAGANALASDSQLPARVGLAVKFMECVLRHRFRYDIEIGEVPTIKVGEFDIEVE